MPPTGLRTGSAPSKRKGAPKLHKRRLRRSQRLFSFDRALGHRYGAGADEAGRGCLAGPLVAAAVLIDYETLSVGDRRILGGLHDSKQMTEERRRDMIKVARGKAEEGRVAIRNVRRKAKEQLDKLVKDGDAGEDEVRRAEKELDDTTHKYVSAVDELVKHKETELLEV